MPPRFFFSYARLDSQDSSGHVDGSFTEFYDELVHEVARKAATHSGEVIRDVGFREQRDLDLGDNWPDELSYAINTSPVFVYLHSPYFFSRPWCGREWTLFRRRIDQWLAGRPPGSPAPPLMIPILWQPCDTLPSCAAHIQCHHERLPPDYARLGLRQLKRISRFRDDYLTALDHLAGAIVRAGNEYQLPSLAKVPPLIADVENAFEHAHAVTAAAAMGPATPVEPRHAQFVVVAARANEVTAEILQGGPSPHAYGETAWEWRPYYPDDPEDIEIAMQRAATAENLRFEKVELAADLHDRLQRAQEDRKLVVVVVDPWTLRLEAYASQVHKYDNYLAPHCALVVPRTRGVAGQVNQVLDVELRRLFATQITLSRGQFHWNSVMTMIELQQALRRTLAALREQMMAHFIATAPAARPAGVPAAVPLLSGVTTR